MDDYVKKEKASWVGMQNNHFTPISSPPPPPYVAVLEKGKISYQINSSIPCLWQHFWNTKAILKPELLLESNLWPTRQEVFGVQLRKLALSSPRESGHPNSLWSCCFKNDVFQHSVITWQCMVSAGCWWSSGCLMILDIINGWWRTTKLHLVVLC